jgi:hypothetical protein
MEQAGSDFTNTFRALSNVKANGSNEEVVKQLIEQSAPKEFFIKRLTHPYKKN